MAAILHWLYIKSLPMQLFCKKYLQFGGIAYACKSDIRVFYDA